MRVLFIEYSFLKGNGGGIYAARAHINMFARLSSFMTLVYPSNSKDDIDGICVNNIAEIYPIKDSRSFFGKVIDGFAGWFCRYSQLSQSLFDAKKYDVVVFDNSMASAYLIDLAKDRGLKVVTIHHNYQVEYFKGDGNPFTKPLDIFWTKRHEGKSVRLSDLNIVLTPQDAELLSNHYSKETHFGVLGVCEYEHLKEENLPNHIRGHNYLITGGLSSRQNEISIIRWIERYYPILLSIDPLAKLTIAGRRPSAKLASIINSHGITLIDSPLDMWPILLDSDFYICPVDCGGGLKLKIMDGLKAGMPIITHSVSARGYENMKENGVLFDYSDERSFVNAVSKAIQCTKSNREVYSLYRSVFSFEQGLNRLKHLLSNNSIIKTD